MSTDASVSSTLITQLTALGSVFERGFGDVSIGVSVIRILDGTRVMF